MTSIDASRPLSISRRPAPLILAFLIALAAGLLLLLPGGPVQAHDPGDTAIFPDDHDTLNHLHYGENGTGLVRTFTSDDPEGLDILWDVTGTDADDFEIMGDSDGNGVLRFKKSPDYEAASDRGLDLDGDGNFTDDGEFAPVDNDYEITVRATEVRAGSSGRALSTESHVTVVVENMDELGVVELNWLQPEVGTMITATLDDVDGLDDLVTPAWQWATSKVDNPDPNDESDWDDATGIGADTAIYTPIGVRVISGAPDPNVSVDEGKYLRAEVMYTDAHGTQTSVMKSYRTVRAEISSNNDDIDNPDNGSPSFKLDTASISLPEDTPVGSNVGSPAEATDPNPGDILTYELAPAPAPNEGDFGSFKIDKMTAQITLAKNLDFERTSPAGAYSVIVRTTDPSGESDDQTLTITAMPANDAPVISGEAEQRVMEQDSDSDAPAPVNLPIPVYTAADEDDRDEITWSLDGEDKDDFLLSAQTQGANEPRDLKFQAPPDYENPIDADFDNVYKVVLVATDANGGVDSRAVTVFVDNAHELGTLMLSPEQPYVDEDVTATLTDPDEDWAVVTWQWFEREGTTGNFTPITGETSGTYTPDEDDDGFYLRAEVTYIDSTSEADDPDTSQIDERVQQAVGTAKAPSEMDGSETDSSRLYKLMATSDQAVDIRDKEDEADPTHVPPSFEVSPLTREVAENARVGHYVGAPVTAERAIAYSLNSGSQDHNAFEINEDGQISVKDIDADAAITTRSDLNYEEKNTYHVKVIATGENNLTATAEVTIRLINLNEGPYFSADATDTTWMRLGPQAKEYDENSMAAVANYQAVDPDKEDNILWYVYGTDAADFTIVGGQLRFVDPPDYEDPTDRGLNLNPRVNETFTDDGEFAPGNNMYQVTVRATERTAEGAGPLKSVDVDLTVTVGNEDEMGTVDLNLLQPEVGTVITGVVIDPDLEVSMERYQWYRAKVGDPALGNVNPDVESTLAAEWTTLTAATSPTYTPQEADVGRRLLVRAEYTDGETSGSKAAIGMSAHPVRADVTDRDNASPDFTSNRATRSIPEDTSVGSPVGRVVIVDHNEDNDVLTYELVMTTGDNPEVVVGDLPFFSIDKASGQIKLEMKLSAEATDGRGYEVADPTIAGIYTVVVRATDPSGETTGNDNRDDITVVITATDVPEAPTVARGNAEIEVDEMNGSCYIGLGNRAGAAAGDCLVDDNVSDENLYKKQDDDENDGVRRWELRGPDRSLFEFSTPDDGIGRRIHFRDAPDYENPGDAGGDNVYNVTVAVIDTAEQVGEKALRIEVINVDETGKLELMPEQPRIGFPVTAALTDADGILIDPSNDLQTVTTWEWYWNGSDVEVVLESDGSVPGTLERIGGANTGDYTPMAVDVGKFLYVKVTYRDGHNTEDDPNTDIDVADERDGRPAPAPGVAADPDRILLARTANAVQALPDAVTDGPPVNVAPVFDPDSVIITVPENTPSTGYVGTPVVAMDSDEGYILSYDLSGVDSRNFALAAANPTYYAQAADLRRDTGPSQIAVKPVTQFDYESGRVYTFEIGATDTQGERTTAELVIEIADVNEAPSEPVELLSDFAISGMASVIIPENSVAVAEYEAVRPPAGTTAMWRLLSGDDDGVLEISGSGVLIFTEAPDYEHPVDEDRDNVYEVTVMGEAGSAQDSIGVMITVTNEDEPGTVTLDPDMPRVGLPIMAELEDPDGVVNVVWEWTKSDNTPGFWPTIASSASPTYTPVEADLGRLLRATARYTDQQSSGPKMVRAITEFAVGPALPPAPEFPASEDGARSVAENAEAGDAVGDPVMADDADSYGLSGLGAASFSIDPTTGQIMVGTGTILDFETQDSYMVTVIATGEGGLMEMAVTITVTNVDEDGTVSLSPATAPTVGAVVTASLIDPDGGVTGIAWQWASSGAMDGTYTDIVGAISSAYTPETGDENMYLRAVASYDDAEGTDKSAAAESANPVVAATAAQTLLEMYDDNDNGGIERDEVLAAIVEFVRDDITRDTVLEVILLFVTSE